MQQSADDRGDADAVAPPGSVVLARHCSDTGLVVPTAAGLRESILAAFDGVVLPRASPSIAKAMMIRAAAAGLDAGISEPPGGAERQDWQRVADEAIPGTRDTLRSYVLAQSDTSSWGPFGELDRAATAFYLPAVMGILLDECERCARFDLRRNFYEVLAAAPRERMVMDRDGESGLGNRMQVFGLPRLAGLSRPQLLTVVELAEFAQHRAQYARHRAEGVPVWQRRSDAEGSPPAGLDWAGEGAEEEERLLAPLRELAGAPPPRQDRLPSPRAWSTGVMAPADE